MATLVQKTGFSSLTNNVQGPQTLSQSFASNNTAGNLLVAFSHMVFGSTGTSNMIANSITDTLGNIWIPSSTISHDGVQMWYVLNCKGGTNSVKASTLNSTGFWFLSIAEYSGVSVVDSPMEAYGINAGSGTSASVSVLVPSSSDLIFSYFACDSNNPPGAFSDFTNGFTEQEAWSFSNFSGTWGDNAASPSAAGLVATGATQSQNAQWYSLIWAFRSTAYTKTSNLAYVRSCSYPTKSGPGVIGTSSPAVVPFAGGNDAGNSIIVVTTQFSNVLSDGVTGITDTNNNKYVLVAKGPTPAGNGGAYCAVYAAQDIVGSPIPNFVSVAYTTTVDTDVCEVFAIEFAGSFVLDTTASISSFTGDGVSGNINAAAAGELLLTMFSIISEAPQSDISSISPAINLTLNIGVFAGITIPNCEQIIAYGISTQGLNAISITTGEVGYNNGVGALTVALMSTPPTNGPQMGGSSMGWLSISRDFVNKRAIDW